MIDFARQHDLLLECSYPRDDATRAATERLDSQEAAR